ncbi:hypothetical protein RJ639_033548 [Escallonia herrerae]|uniref:14-3-3 domain-containing protein n=1 Tax=Escallonia herrerae TaxID=1293975 RepID=A0AA89BB29_9ASTE|nr:hypothetical protein RJ639_033548 [Escallonia herrerae]
MQEERKKQVYLARLAEQAERYDVSLSLLIYGEVLGRATPRIAKPLVVLTMGNGPIRGKMVEAMKEVAKLDVELTVEERNLVSAGYKNVIGARRASWRILSSIEQKEEGKGHEQNAKRIKGYRERVEDELTKICNDILSVIDKHLIPSASTGASTVFYYKIPPRGVFGTYLPWYRYLAEFKSGTDRKEAADQSLKAYEAATTAAASDLPPTHPIRLGLTLNFSVFFYEILNSPESFAIKAKGTMT